MKLTEINPEKTPGRFYSAQDAEGNWLETEHIPCDFGTRLRKRCLGGWQDIELKAGVLKLFFLPETEFVNEDETVSIIPGEEIQVADGQLIPQKIDWELDDWVNMSFGLEHIFSGVYEFGSEYDAWSLFNNGVDSVQVDFAWRMNNSKQTYSLSSAIGERVRMAAIVNDYKEPGVDVKQSFSDFLGLTLVETLADQEDLLSKKYVFESDGFELTEAQPSFEVDPYLVIVEAARTITVTSDGDELVFGDTYDATVLESSEIHCKIQETNLISTIYADILFQYGTGTSDLSGNTYSAINIDTNYDWFPLTSTAYTNRTTRTTQLQDPDDLTITTGTPAGDTTDGFEYADGAYHFEADAGEVQIAFEDNTQINPVFVIEDFPYQSGDPDDPDTVNEVDVVNYGAYFTGNGSVDTDLAHEDILFYWDGSDCTSSNVSIGGVNGTLGSNNTGGTTSFPTTGGIGGGAYFDNESNSLGYQIGFPVTNNNILNKHKGSLSLFIKVQDFVDYDYFFGARVDNDNRFRLYIMEDGSIEARYNAGGGAYYLDSVTQVLFTDTWHHILFTWEDNGGSCNLYVDGIKVDDSVTAANTFVGDIPTLFFSTDDMSVRPANCFLDEIYITNNPNTPQIPTANGVPLHCPILGDE